MKRRKLLWLTSTCAVVSSLCGPRPASAQDKSDPLIVPGKSVGEIRLGMEDPEIERRLGKANTGNSAAGTYFSAWFGKQEGGGRGLESDVKSTHFGEHDREAARGGDPVGVAVLPHKREGISTKSSLADVWKAFPDLRYADDGSSDKTMEIYEDNARGFAIEVRRTMTSADATTAPAGAWGVCQAIVIYPADTSSQGGALRLHSVRDQPDE